MADLHDSATFIARVTTDVAIAGAVQDALAEVCDGEAVAISIAQASQNDADARWSLALHFREQPDEPALRALIAAVAERVVNRDVARALARDLTLEALAPTDWVRRSLDGLTPVEAGRFVVHGEHYRGRFAANRISIEIDAGLAFGTGHHGSTRGCLLALDAIVKRARSRRVTRATLAKARHPTSRAVKKAAVLDIGTGTGVLAIAAAKALHRPVLASDIDARAVATARDNARINRIGGWIQVVRAAGIGGRHFSDRSPFGVVLANILLEPLERLATPLFKVAASHGYVVLSGLLNSQARAALASYRARGFTLAQRITLGGWTTLVVRRKGGLARRACIRNLRRR
jgi:ribosomal protein L11 methyltransferase